MYDKEQVPVQKITHNNIVKTDLRGLGTKVGSFSNCATIIEAMKGVFTDDKHKEQRAELSLRKQMLREIVGNEIDSAKGLPKPSLPAAWKKYMQINPEDTDIVKADKYKHNSLVISKKPYFFRYLYPELNKKFKQYENVYNVVSKDMFGIKFKKLLFIKDKTEEQKLLIRRYQKFSPLLVSSCLMNLLCKEFENIDFNIKYKNGGVNMLPLYENEGFVCEVEKSKIFKDCYRKYNNKKALKIVEGIFEDVNKDDFKEIRASIFEDLIQEIQEDIFSLGLTPQQIMFYIGQLSKEYKQFNWSFAWEVLADFILELIPQGDSYFPIENQFGKNYLGRQYILASLYEENIEEVDFEYDFELEL